MNKEIFFKKVIFGLLLALSSRPALAQTGCEANFQEEGDPRNGATFKTFAIFPRMDARSALGQMEKQLSDAGFALGSEEYQGKRGSLIFITKGGGSVFKSLLSNGSPFKTNGGVPSIVGADETTRRLTIIYKLRPDQKMTPDQARTFLCGMVGNVKIDREGAAVAAAQHAKTHSDEIVNITAYKLAQDIVSSGAMHRGTIYGGSTGFGSPSQTKQLQFIGRVYRLDGQVIMPQGLDIAYNLGKKMTFQSYKVLPLGAKMDPGVVLECENDPSQRQRFANLRTGDYATVIAKIIGFNGAVNMSCRFEK